jgi:hypothetical protein
MEFGILQVIVSVGLIFGAAGVALLCDFQKRKNDQLREEMAQLQVRHEEVQPVGAPPTGSLSRIVPPPSLPVAVPVAPVMPIEDAALVAVMADHPSERVVEHPVAAAIARSHGRMNGRSIGRDRDGGENLVRKPSSTTRDKAPIPSNSDRSADVTSVTGRRQSPPALVPEILPEVAQMKSKEALADWLSRRKLAAQCAQTTASQISIPEPQKTATPTPVSTPIEMQPPPTIEQVVMSGPVAASEPVLKCEPVVVEKAAPSPAAVSQISVEIDSALWESLISGTPIAVENAPTPVVIVSAPVEIADAPEVPETKFVLIQGAASTSNAAAIPSGMFDQSALRRLLESKKPFTGLAVSIGINENDGSAPRSEDLIRSTSLFISGLLQDGDFGCQSGGDEFLMLCPGPQGAEAQRRLSQIAERLWDFQLRGIGTFSILFSWGGVEVNDESLADTIASAADRMYQTKRSRKTVSMESVSQRRKAV